MSLPKVSVLIPAYNAERFIGATLESVFAQTWREIEVVVVNDGSTDRTGDEVRKFSRQNLKLVEQENRGQTAALNECLRHATGDLIQYLDADDLIDADKIERQVVRLSDRPTSVASAEWGRFYATPEETRFDPEPVWRDLDPLDWLALSRAEGLGMMFPALWLIPAPIAHAVGPWREELTLNNDAEYFTRVLLAADRVLFCAGARCRYRSGLTSSLSGQRSQRHWLSQMRVLQLCESHISARENSDRVRRGFSLSWQRLAHACYPYAPDLAARALAHARELHAVKLDPDGGAAFKTVRDLLGWRIARKLQVLSGRA